MKLLHFVDAAGTDEHFVAADQVTMVSVTDNASVIVNFKSQDPAVTANDQVDLTCTAGKSDEVALVLAQYMAAEKNDVLTVKASTGDFADVTTVAYTAGT